jgi:sterol desaturase/sphingolipid hydroxylase (fatty acid hydroxylase superfamily)
MRGTEARERAVAAIPSNYRAWRHIAFTVGSGLLPLAIALGFVKDVRWWELLVVPAMLLFSNAAEWRAHRDLLHKKRPGLALLYERHTPIHHVVFQYETMPVTSYRELALVLLPSFGVGLIVVVVAPIAAALGYFLSPNTGWLIVATAGVYVVLYEVTHLVYHLPPEHPLARPKLVAWLREHHRRHHDPRLMQKWNFNVTFPLWDILRGTRISDAKFAELTGKRPADETGDAAAERV